MISFGIIVFYSSNSPKKVNWSPVYTNRETKPYGTYIAYNLISQSYAKQGVKEIPANVYDFLGSKKKHAGSYLFINDAVVFSRRDLSRMLPWVEKGNVLFVSAKEIDSKLLDTLKISSSTLEIIGYLESRPMVSLTNNSLKSKKALFFDRNSKNVYFDVIDTLKTKTLGYIEVRRPSLVHQNPSANYLEIPYGKGKILLHTFPEAFTNFFILHKKNNYKYTQNLLAYIDQTKPIYWDNYYKNGKIPYSELYFFTQNKYLKYSYYTILIGFIIFLFFEGKRKQRSIPIRVPLQNQTLAFTKTISNIYFESKKHKEIATKQQKLFMEYIRNQLRIITDVLDQKCISDIAIRSGNSQKTTQNLFEYFDTIKMKKKINAAELKLLHEKIESFKRKTH